MLEDLEKTYKEHELAKEISLKKYDQLEKKRSYFWNIVGDPPLLKPFKKILDNEWTPTVLICILGIGFFIAASVFINSIGLIVVGMGIMFTIGVVRRQENKLNYLNKKAIRKFKHKFFHERNNV